MLTKDELKELIRESSRAERTVSVNDTDKFCEAVRVFANDISDSKQNGYLLVGVHDDGRLKRRCRYSGAIAAIAYNNFPWSQDANGQGTQRTEGTKGTEATKETKRTEETKGTKVTEATRETKAVSRSLTSLPSLSSLEGGSNG